MENADTDYSKYTPQHPLPTEVQKMNRDETVCKFCGVSYLIHNEIKALEDKLKLAENELAHYRGSEKREEQLKNELNELKNINEKNSQDLIEKNQIINELKNDIENLQSEKNKLNHKEKELSEKLQSLQIALDNLQEKHRKLCNTLPSVIRELKEQKAFLSAVKPLVSARDNLFKEESQHISNVLETFCQEQVKKQEANTLKLHELEKDRLNFKFKEEKYVSEIKQFEAKIGLLQVTCDEADVTKLHYKELQSANKDLKAEISKVLEKNKDLIVEINKSKDELKQMQQEYENERKSSVYTTEQLKDKLEKDLKNKESELQTVVRELGRMKAKYEEQQEELNKASSLSNLKTKTLHEELCRVKGDLSALKEEREMMITAHQNQIAQLRESYRKKVGESEKLPEKLEELLKKEKEKHNEELSMLEQKLKENFIYELQIEKQKQKELAKKQLEEIQSKEETLSVQFSNLQNKHKSEVSELHKQLAEYKARARESENTLRAEISNLKKIISDLEKRLGRLDSGSDEKVTEFKFEIKKLENVITTHKEENRKLQEQLNAAKEENGFLQETVRRECEERFELAETLSSLKEELLQYKKPVGGYTPSPHPSTAAESNFTSPSSEEMVLFRKSSKPRQPSHARERESGASNSVVLGYAGQQAKTPTGLKGNKSSVGDSRKRISDAVGRK